MYSWPLIWNVQVTWYRMSDKWPMGRPTEGIYAKVNGKKVDSYKRSVYGRRGKNREGFVTDSPHWQKYHLMM
jgi:hypothetical protein